MKQIKQLIGTFYSKWILICNYRNDSTFLLIGKGFFFFFGEHFKRVFPGKSFIYKSKFNEIILHEPISDFHYFMFSQNMKPIN